MLSMEDLQLCRIVYEGVMRGGDARSIFRKLCLRLGVESGDLDEQYDRLHDLCRAARPQRCCFDHAVLLWFTSPCLALKGPLIFH